VGFQPVGSVFTTFPVGRGAWYWPEVFAACPFRNPPSMMWVEADGPFE